MSAIENTEALVEMIGIGKQFPGVRALHEVDLQINRGEVLALLGENGAGKSTLIKMLGGAHQPDRGEIRVDGAAVSLTSAKASREKGI
ncbi:MAG: ATP-binding cassette domain-containing protein, partial [Verrucomicrobiota bacterium]